ncbi:hypothetical protein [uncultured Desulfobacter sp.]|uniref:hypothetical protein n=1 Tax=uncultured Desulfobacter sp. TaxID=240139 RepID=UPI002AAA7838|nr:hypothetical protein [uncultured Desulfobacter sp.]
MRNIKTIFFVICALCCLLSLSCAAGMKRVAIVRYQLPPKNFSDVILSFKKVMEINGYIEGKNIEYIDLLTDTMTRHPFPRSMNSPGNIKTRWIFF